MERICRWGLLVLCLLALFVPGRPVRADDDDEGSGAVLNADLQWRLACSSWDRREYEEAAALMRSYGKANPDDENVLEAFWRCYTIFRDYRPNQEKRKTVYDEAINACQHWRTKYAEDNKERAARGLWYKSQLLEREGMRPMGVVALNELTSKLGGTRWDEQAFWTLGEWLRDGNRWSEAITAYTNYRQVVGNTEYSAGALFRIGWCNESLGNKEAAVAAYKTALTDDKLNWGWGQVHWNALDAARRCRAMGYDDVGRALALKILDKTPKDWTDLQNQARAFLGEKLNNTKLIHIYPHLIETYSSSNISVTGGTKMTLKREIPVLVRLERVSKDDPFHGTLSVTPKISLAGNPDNLKLKEEGGKKNYSAQVDAPDARGGVTGDWWFHFTTEEQSVAPPDNVSITRSWENGGDGMGICTIRIQSTTRWHIWIYMPNDKTNVVNLSIKPHDVGDNGRTFHWNDWIDLSQGMTIKFPIEGAGDTYFPHIRLEHNIGGYCPNQSGTNMYATYETPLLSVKLSSEKPFAYSFEFPGTRVIELAAVAK